MDTVGALRAQSGGDPEGVCKADSLGGLGIEDVSTSNRPMWSESQIKNAEAVELQALTRMFTVDACADPGGGNALTREFCVGVEGFVSYDCGGDHVWLHGPQKDLPVMINHYQDCKARSPGDTRAC